MYLRFVTFMFIFAWRVSRRMIFQRAMLNLLLNDKAIGIDKLCSKRFKSVD